MAKTSLAKKLRIGAGQQILILNAPPGYLERLAPLPEGSEVFERPGGSFDLVHLFVQNKAQLERLVPGAVEAAGYDGLLWISYPKRSSKMDTDLTRDVGWDVIDGLGLRPVTQVSVDDTWSALRFRPAQEVGKRSR
jgi:hypothetical protein